MSDFLVIAYPIAGAKPHIVVRTTNEERARAHAHTWLRRSTRDVLVFDLDTHECVLAICDEPAEGPP